ncbi:unnamed protein product [Bubo scandiacus]
MAVLLLVALLALLCPPRVQPAGVLELRVLSARGGPGGPCGGPPSCRLIFRLCLRPPGGNGCSLGVAHSPPRDPPPAAEAPRILHLPFAFPWPGNPSPSSSSHGGLEEAKGSGGPQGRLLGRTVARQHLSPGGPWRGGCWGGPTLQHPPALPALHPTGPAAPPAAPPCARRCTPALPPPPAAAGPPCCARRERGGCSGTPPIPTPPGNGAAHAGSRQRLPGARAATPPGPGRAPEAPAGPGASPRRCPPSPCALGSLLQRRAPAPWPPAPATPAAAPPGFRGFNCERRADRCDDHLCLHGGQCQDLGRGAICKCRPGFSGRWCERNADDCTPNPCANGGTCQDGANSFTCSCTLGYAGADCRRRADACASGPCLQRGHLLHPLLWPRLRLPPPDLWGPAVRRKLGGPPPAPPPPASRAPCPGLCPPPLALLGPGVVLALAARRRAAADGGEAQHRWPPRLLPLRLHLPRAVLVHAGAQEDVGRQGSRCAGDALGDREDGVTAVAHRRLSAADPSIVSLPRPGPLDVTKLIYCSRTVPEIEKVIEELRKLMDFYEKELGGEGAVPGAGAELQEEPLHPPRGVLAALREGGGQQLPPTPWGASLGDLQLHPPVCLPRSLTPMGVRCPSPYGIYNLDDLKAHGRQKGWCPHISSPVTSILHANIVVYRLPLPAGSQNRRPGFQGVSQKISRGLRRGSQYRQRLHRFHGGEHHNAGRWTAARPTWPLSRPPSKRSMETDARRLAEEYRRLVEGLREASTARETDLYLANPVLPGRDPARGGSRQHPDGRALCGVPEAVRGPICGRGVRGATGGAGEPPPPSSRTCMRRFASSANPCGSAPSVCARCCGRWRSWTWPISPAITLVANFATLVSTYSKGFTIIIEPSMTGPPPSPTPSCTSAAWTPSIAIKPVFERFQSVIITSGVRPCVPPPSTSPPGPIGVTPSVCAPPPPDSLPLWTFTPKILDFRPVTMATFTMTLARTCLCPMIVGRGNDQVAISSKFETREDIAVIPQLREPAAGALGRGPRRHRRLLHQLPVHGEHRGLLVRAGHPGEHSTQQTPLHRDAGWGRDQHGPGEIPGGLRERPRCHPALGGPRQSVGGHRFRAPLRQSRHHVRGALRLHPEPHPEGPAGIPAGPVPDPGRTISSPSTPCATRPSASAGPCAAKPTTASWSSPTSVLPARDKRGKLPRWIQEHITDSNLNLTVDEAVQVAKFFLRQMAQPFHQEDQLGLSLLTLEQLQSEEILQRIEQIAQQV